MSDTEILLRSQMNQIFQAISEVGLEPSEFQWAKSEGSDGFTANEKNALKITHKPTDYYFVFDQWDGDWFCRFIPSLDNAKEVTRYRIKSWEAVFDNFKSWVGTVSREHAEPDLWGASQQEKKLIAEQIDDLENSLFSESERQRIASAVNELKEFLITNGNHSDSQIQFITTRLKHLEEASHRLGRKDWITLAMGTITNIVVGVALAPEAARELLRIAGSLLGWVVGNVHLLP